MNPTEKKMCWNKFSGTKYVTHLVWPALKACYKYWYTCSTEEPFLHDLEATFIFH